MSAYAQASTWLCGTCGHISDQQGMCPACGGEQGRVVRGGVVEMPAGSIPCPQCQRRDVRIVFRGWSRLYALAYWARETRSSAYLCSDCARKQTIINLLVTAFLGWWSFPSLWYGPKATYFNWRSVWAPPAEPLAWGAIGLDELLASATSEGPGPEESAAFGDSPLAGLTAMERHLVLNAEVDPYEVLGVSPQASESEIRTAWRDRAKSAHPDVNPDDASAASKMLQLNQAYEILGNPRLRAAYDWLQTSGREFVS